MISKNNLENELENLEGLSSLIQAFEEIAATRIKRTRDSVLTSRDFSSEINEIFEEVILSYKRQVNALMKAKKVKNINKLSFINKNGKTLYLIFSANTGLYGGIVRKTFDLFLKAQKDKNYDVAIIGKLGLQMWKDLKFNEKYYYFDFPDRGMDNKKFKEMLNFIINYDKTIAFYGQFQNLIVQDATYTDISGTNLTETNIKREQVKYFFEPSLEKIMEFFEKQIFSSIFEQTIRESQLAKIASRLTALDKASVNIEKELKLLSLQTNRISHQQQNKKQLETFSSRLLWKNI